MKLPALALLLLLAAAPCRPESDGEDSRSFQTIIVKPGDTLWAIANKYLKDPARWDEILKHNRLPTKDPTVALPGMSLSVPVRLIKAQMRAARLVYTVNRVLHRRKETPDWRPSKLAMELFQGDILRTLDDSKARVQLLNKELLSLEPNSMAVIKPLGRDGDLELKSGSVFAGRARVITATALITPRTQDTRYAASIEADLTTRVEVYKGAAGVDAQGGSVEVTAGMGTRIQPGLAPELPRAIANLPELENRAFEYASALKVGGGAAPEPRAPVELAPTPEADADSLRAELQSLRIGTPIGGYHVQAATDKDFTRLVFDKHFEPDDRLRPNDEGLKPGAYWWRIAIIDLLGTEGHFSNPRYYTVGIKREAAPITSDLKNALVISSPGEEAVVSGDHVRVFGILRDDRLGLRIAGRAVRADADGNFIAMVPLRLGLNEINIEVFDPAGNSSQLTRRVTRR